MNLRVPVSKSIGSNPAAVGGLPGILFTDDNNALRVGTRIHGALIDNVNGIT